MNSKDTLASALNEVLLRRGWTQRPLADAIGIDPSRISRVLGGHEGMSMTRVPELAEVMGRDEEEVAALVWAARREPGKRPSTLSERVIALEEQMARIGDNVEHLTGLLEREFARQATEQARETFPTN